MNLFHNSSQICPRKKSINVKGFNWPGMVNLLRINSLKSHSDLKVRLAIYREPIIPFVKIKKPMIAYNYHS